MLGRFVIILKIGKIGKIGNEREWQMNENGKCETGEDGVGNMKGVCIEVIPAYEETTVPQIRGTMVCLDYLLSHDSHNEKLTKKRIKGVFKFIVIQPFLVLVGDREE